MKTKEDYMNALIEARQKRFLKMRCKVCGKSVLPSENHVKVYYEGIHHVVCCGSCAAKFEEAPERCLVCETTEGTCA